MGDLWKNLVDHIEVVTGAVITAIGAIFVAALNRKPKEPQPPISEQITDAFKILIEEYKDQVKELTSQIKVLKLEVNCLTDHVAVLTDLLERHGVTAPARRRG